MADSVKIGHVTKKKAVLNFIQDHKFISILIGLGVLAGVYFGYNAIKTSTVPVRYGVTQAQKGTLIMTVSGSGQVLASHQIDIKPKISGTVTNVLVKQGDKVKEGQALVQLDAKDANKAVRDAKLNVTSAQIALQKLTEPPDKLALVQAQNSLSSAQNALTLLTNPPDADTLIQAQNAVATAQINLQQAMTGSTQQTLTDSQNLQTDLDNAYNSISTAYINIPGFITDIEDVKSTSSNNGQTTDNIGGYYGILGKDSPYIVAFLNSYDSTINDYNTAFTEYKMTPRTSGQTALYKMISDSLNLENEVSLELENARNIFDAITNFTKTSGTNYSILSVVNTLGPKIESDISTLNSSISSLRSAKNDLDTVNQNLPLNTQKSQDAISTAQATLNEKQQALAKLVAGAKPEDIANAQNNVKQAQAALDKLKQGADALDVKNAQLNLQQRQNSLQDAKDNLVNYTVTSPFDGVVASIAAVNGDTALNGQSTASSTSVAVIITNQLLAQVSLNEVDAAKIALGDKATLAFDAVPDVSITGQLVQIDTIGTSAQGVVSYNAEVAFDTQDARIKPGMSVTTAIITAVNQDVLLVPNAAIKTQGTVSYVQVFDSSVVTQDASTNTSGSPDITGTAPGGGTGTVVSLTAPQRKFVQAGSSNDTSTEITGGIAEGDWVVTQTFTNSATSAAATPAVGGNLRIPGLGGGGGAARGG